MVLFVYFPIQVVLICNRFSPQDALIKAYSWTESACHELESAEAILAQEVGNDQQCRWLSPRKLSASWVAPCGPTADGPKEEVSVLLVAPHPWCQLIPRSVHAQPACTLPVQAPYGDRKSVV